MLKNRYFSIQLLNEEKTTYLIRVKKDFYAEGINTKSEEILQGYFYIYKNIVLNILSNEDLTSTIGEHKGISGNISTGLSFVGIDEELMTYSNSNKIPVIIEEIEENSELVKKLDFLLRKGIRNLSPNNKTIYDYFNSRRIETFKELKSEITTPIHRINSGEYIAIDDPSFGITREDLKEIEEYLKSLSQPSQSQRGRDESGKKLRKKRKKK